MMDIISLRTKQIEAVKSMLNPFSDPQPDWKFIIYDNVGRDILEQLFPNKDLKSHFVTLHLLINSDREPVPEVSAVYFVMPTGENIERICFDLKNHLYNCYYLNFISSLSSLQLKTIADAAVQSESATEVRKVFSQHLNFIALEDNLFVLRESEKHLVSYYAIHRRDVSDSTITEALDHIVDCLFSLLATLNIIPVIRSPKGGAAEVVAKKLTDKLRKSLNDTTKTNGDNSSLFSKRKCKSSSFVNPRRKLLCLVDRSVDMSTPLHHTWTYQALIHDLLNTELNRITIIDDSDKTKLKAKLFDLNPDDKFWRDHRGNPFPQVAEAVQAEFEKFKKHKDELNGLKSTLSLDKVIKDHTTIATVVLEAIKARKLDNFFELEEKIMNRNQIDKVIFDEMLADPDYGHLNDKYRLFLIAYICDNPNLTEDEANKYVEILEGFGCNRMAFEYIKSWKDFSRTNVASLQSSLKSSGGVLKTASMFTKLMSQGSQFVMEGVKNLVLKEHYLPLTKIVDALMDCSSRTSRESLEYTYFDPQSKNDQVANREKVFNEVIVFVVGGGNYIEYQNLLDYCKSKSTFASGHPITKHVIYGSTDLVNANQFLQHLELVGSS